MAKKSSKKKAEPTLAVVSEEPTAEPTETATAENKTIRDEVKDKVIFRMKGEGEKTPQGWKDCPKCGGILSGPNKPICPNCKYEFPKGKRAGRPAGSANKSKADRAAGSSRIAHNASANGTSGNALEAAATLLEAAGNLENAKAALQRLAKIAKLV